MAKTLRMTGWPPRNRSPATNNVAAAAPSGSEIGGDGAMRANTTSATTKVEASAMYALVRPKVPMSTPATAGPDIQPNDV